MPSACPLCPEPAAGPRGAEGQPGELAADGRLDRIQNAQEGVRLVGLTRLHLPLGKEGHPRSAARWSLRGVRGRPLPPPASGLPPGTADGASRPAAVRDACPGPACSPFSLVSQGANALPRGTCDTCLKCVAKMPSGPRTRLRWTADRPPACESANRRQVPAPCRAPGRPPGPIKPAQKWKDYTLAPALRGRGGHRAGDGHPGGPPAGGRPHPPSGPCSARPGRLCPGLDPLGAAPLPERGHFCPGPQLSPEMDGDYPTRRQACCRDTGAAQIPSPHPRPARATHPGDMWPVSPGDILPPAPTQAGGPRRTPWGRPGLQTLAPHRPRTHSRTASTRTGLTLESSWWHPVLSGLVTATAFSVPWGRGTGRDLRLGLVSQPPRSLPCSLALGPGVPTCSVGHTPLHRVPRDPEGVQPAARGL